MLRHLEFFQLSVHLPVHVLVDLLLCPLLGPRVARAVSVDLAAPRASARVPCDVTAKESRGNLPQQRPRGRDGDTDYAEGAFDDCPVQRGDEEIYTC